MVIPILSTKLHIPPLRENLLLRQRLFEQLEGGLSHKLSLISAPAGFGKTSLVSSWIAHSKRPCTWLSLDETDNDPNQFLTYLITALQAAEPSLEVAALLQAPQASPIKHSLISLINALGGIREQLVMVLDDYHRIQSSEIDQSLSFFLDHLPATVHLMMITREDPSLPLARLRARHQLTELRAADLRFTAAEVSDFLNEAMALNLSAQDIAALESRTEGWITGLQLAAISMRGHQDVSRFIKSFAGSHRFVLDYLVEEVLQQQPKNIQTFLLYTAILDRLCTPLCDALLPDASAEATLEYLERANLLIFPLDEERQWYRYHHLFTEVLQTRLMKLQPEKIPDLHLRASAWYEQQALPADAIRHAFAAKDYRQAAILIEQTWQAMRRTRQEATVLAWMRALPDKLIRISPGLSVGYAWALLDAEQLDEAEARLRDAEYWLNNPSSEMLVADQKQFQALPASIANARAFHAQTLGDLAGTVTYTQQALERLPQDEYYERGTATALLGLAYWSSGNLEAAYQSFAAGVDNLHRSGGFLILIGAAYILANIRIMQGRLHEAKRVLEETLRLTATKEAHLLKGIPELYLGLGEIHYEQGNLRAAKEALAQGKALGEQASLPGYAYSWCMTEARIRQAEGDIENALNLLKQAEQLAYRSPIPDIRPLGALRARMRIKGGRLSDALDWVREQGLTPHDELTFLREYEHITLVRVLLTQYRVHGLSDALGQASTLLERLLKAVEEMGRERNLIEMLVLQALVYHAQGKISDALASLEQALNLAAPQRYGQVFFDEGAPMIALLQLAAKQNNYAHQLLAAFGKDEAKPFTEQPLHEPLTERELAVLRLLASDLSGPEIADMLMVALSTIRSHSKSIYYKLNVNSRRAAVTRATELGLL